MAIEVDTKDCTALGDAELVRPRPLDGGADNGVEDRHRNPVEAPERPRHLALMLRGKFLSQ